MVPIGFYAYPSASSHLTETIEGAISSINKRNVVQLKSWRRMRSSGKIVIQAILNQIKDADLFLCDLTGLNPNVLFELGYAIALGKRVWLTVDATRPKNIDQVKSLNLVSTLGYVEHTNDDQITTKYLNESPHIDLDSHALSPHSSLLEGLRAAHPTTDVFYMPSSVESTAVKRLVRHLSSLKEQNGRRVVVDDRLENSYEPLQWYLRNILDSSATIAHLDDEGSEGALYNNARCSLLAGMSLGFERHTLMIAPSPFDPPFDYRDLLVKYKDAHHCRSAVEKWLQPILLTRVHPRPPIQDSELTLLAFHIGETTAENEEQRLSDYYVQTAAFSAGTKSTTGIFVGRKGTGKTANLYQIRDHFQSESQNLVVTIKPVSFRIAAFGRLLKDFFPNPELATDFIERTWRAIIYAEVAIQACRYIRRTTRYREPSDDERLLLDHVEAHHEFVETDFAGKIDVIRKIVEDSVRRQNDPKTALNRIAKELTGPLVDAYARMFRKYQKVVILVDNLDKAWSVDGDVAVQVQLIFGVMGFQNTIRRDLALTEGDVRVLVFLREDIFTHVMASANEPDKVRLGVFPIVWPHSSQLIHILEKRFVACSPDLPVDQIWERLFCPKIRGVDAKHHLTHHTMPRPRDLIHVVRTAIDQCVGKSHSRIEADDIEDALRQYFQFLIDNMFSEYGLHMPNLRDIIQSFVECPSRLGYRVIRKLVRPHSRSSGGAQRVAEFLFRVSFLGIERSGEEKFALY